MIFVIGSIARTVGLSWTPMAPSFLCVASPIPDPPSVETDDRTLVVDRTARELNAAPWLQHGPTSAPPRRFSALARVVVESAQLCRMLENASPRRRVTWLAAAGACAALLLASPALRAGEAIVTAPDAVVRSAPFEVAPALSHVHAGDKLPADDRPQGAWRRVRLPDGRWGLVHDAEVTVTVAPPPSTPPADAPSGPRELKAKVVVFEVGVRAAPATDAPVLKMLPQGAEVVLSGDAPEGWRRVQLSDGRSGFVAALAVKTDAAVASAPPARSCLRVRSPPPSRDRAAAGRPRSTQRSRPPWRPSSTPP
jgi:hypothetical protein